jgi:hypothetical protein
MASGQISPFADMKYLASLAQGFARCSVSVAAMPPS